MKLLPVACESNCITLLYFVSKYLDKALKLKALNRRYPATDV